MLGRVGWVLELLQDDTAWNRVAQLLSSTDSTSHSVLTAGQTHLGTIGLHQVTTLHTHGLGHGENEVIATYGRYQCQSDTCVTTGGFDDGSSRLEDAFLLSIFYHGQCDTVFHTATGVEELYFCNDRSLKSFLCRKLAQFE